MRNIQTARLVLASASPRRAQLLRQLHLPFQQISPVIDETIVAGENVTDYVLRMAREKALATWEQQSLQVPAVVLAADTCGEIAGQLLSKPNDFADAKRLLKLLSGKTHRIYSAFALYDGEHLQVQYVASHVTFRLLSDEEIVAYWQTGEPQDKAGAYAIQGQGARFVSHLSGSYSAVMGLPLFEVAQALADFKMGTLL